MYKSIISPILVGVLLFPQVLVVSPAKAAPTPEDQCFNQLRQAANSSPAFSGLDLTKVRKINGKNGEEKSKFFSVATHADFLKVFTTPHPFYEYDIPYFPDAMDEVPSRDKFTPKVHKANRTNSASLIYENGIKTDIDHWMSKNGSATGQDIRDYFSGRKNANSLDGKHHRQIIDGYFIDSKYVTFGRESDLEFSFPTRAANPASYGFYPVGRPIPDMREYLMYTHHLSPQFGGHFLSCELVKMTPQAGYVLKDYDYAGKSIRWQNYGGSKLSQTDITTKNLAGGKFRQGNLRYTITTRQDTDKNLLRFDLINISYNNASSFLNPYITLDLFQKSVLDAKTATLTFLDMRRDFYNRVIATGMGIGQGVTQVEDKNSAIATANWVKCADEGQLCQFTGESDIRYGQNDRYVYKKATDSVACNNSEFGDPIFGTLKSCWYDSNQASAYVPPVSSGTVICTHYHQKGLLSDELFESEKAYGEIVHPQLYSGYLYWATPFVAWLEKNEWADFIVAPLVNAWAEEVAYHMGDRQTGNWIGRKMMQFGEPATLMVGKTILVKNKFKSSLLQNQ